MVYVLVHRCRSLSEQRQKAEPQLPALLYNIRHAKDIHILTVSEDLVVGAEYNNTCADSHQSLASLRARSTQHSHCLGGRCLRAEFVVHAM